MYYRRPCQNTETQKLITDVKQCEQGFYCKPTALPFKIHHFHIHRTTTVFDSRLGSTIKPRRNWKEWLCKFFSWGEGGGEGKQGALRSM